MSEADLDATPMEPVETALMNAGDSQLSSTRHADGIFISGSAVAAIDRLLNQNGEQGASAICSIESGPGS